MNMDPSADSPENGGPEKERGSVADGELGRGKVTYGEYGKGKGPHGEHWAGEGDKKRPEEREQGTEENVERPKGDEQGTEENIDRPEGDEQGPEEYVERPEGDEQGLEENVDRPEGNEPGQEGNRERSEDDQPLNFMDLVPIRIKEHIQQDWQVGFKQSRFESRFWNWFFVHIGATENFVVRLDRMGSEIFGYIDGKRNVRKILVRLEINHTDEEDLRDRLVNYLKRLKFHEFIDLVGGEKGTSSN